MKKFKTIKWAAISFVGTSAVVMASLAGAQTTPLAASCAGTVASSTITWTVAASGGVSPYSYLWLSGDGVTGSTSTSVAVTYATNGTRSVSVRASDSASSTASTTATCSATVTSFPANATSTPPTHNQSVRVQPKLQVEQNGRFLARGLIVQSVGVNSFTGTVWGVTYTVNINTAATPDFYLEKDNNARRFDFSQIRVGDEMGVSGWVSVSAPLVVNAQVLRDYSLIKPRSQAEIKGNKNEGGDNKNSSSTEEIRSRLNNLFQQLKDLQDKVKNRFGGGD